VDLRPAFARRVRNRRKALKLSQEALAERAGLHWTYISGIERGIRNPGLNNVAAVAHALGLTPSALLRGLSGRPTEQRTRR
jgi:transcriptional regulator with XRE-family HTH domain